MIRLTLLQFRVQAALAFCALAAAAVALAVTGPRLTRMYQASGIATCQGHAKCVQLATTFLSKLADGQVDQILYFLGIGVLFTVPAFVGMFWGAPLISREIEAHTLQLAWTQGVTRNRWLAVKLGIIGVASMATAGVLSFMFTRWSRPIDHAIGLKYGDSVTFARLGLVLFPTRDITPVGYAAFAFALGVTAGVLLRRIVPAMFVTLVGFAAVQVGWPLWIRPHLIAPVRTTVALTRTNISSLAVTGDDRLTVNPPLAATDPGSWILSNRTVDEAGQSFNAATVRPCVAGTFKSCQAALGRLHLRDLVSYQPATRFWALQWHETAIFVGLAVVLIGVCFWRVRRSS
jgi:ABC-2 family transporter protein